MLTLGTRLGSYSILEQIGVGGMGEVYRARDTKLNRDVAVKVLPHEFSDDAERMARFAREAQVLASLNHPRIASIYGLEETNGIRALVMELVEGPTLAEHIAQGAIPLEEALPIARQIAEALEYAHERGIIHRDLKPANIKLTPDGAVKILDFGLAKALENESAEKDTATSPTLTIASTKAGVLIGTAAYMSPEQARGKRVDRRTDIWAFGCVLFEMLSGKSVFSGETVSDTLAGVIKEDPDWTQLPADLSSRLKELLRRCLQKDPRRRLQAIGDARLELEEAPWTSISSADTLSSAAASRLKLWPGPILGGILGLLLGGLAVVAVLLILGRHPDPLPVHLSFTLPESQSFVNDGSGLAISPDGRLVAFVASGTGTGRQIWLRRLDDFSAKPMPGTNGATSPFFSPDGQWLAYFAAHKLQKISLVGGPSQVLCVTAGTGSGTWAPDDMIYFSGDVGPLMRVPAAGGKCEQFLSPEEGSGELSLLQPEMLPGGENLLLTIQKGFNAEQSSIAVVSVKTHQHKILLGNATSPRYVEPGFIVFGRSGTLWAIPFDLKRAAVAGNAEPLIEGIANNDSGAFEQFAVSDNGILVYAPGSEAQAVRQVVEVDRNGTLHAITTDNHPYEDLALSPDGRHLAMTIEGPMWNIWTFDLQRSTLTRLTFENDNRDPFWSPDSKAVTYASLRNGHWGLFSKFADGTGSEKTVYTSTNWVFPCSFSPDGKHLAFVQQDPASSADIWTLALQDGQAAPFLKTPFTEWFPQYSPDSRWIAYESNESGRAEIYVQSASGGGKWQVSTEGGIRPVWPNNSKEIFYLNGNKLMAVPVVTSPTFAVGKPHELFEKDFFPSGHYYDATADGQRFYFIKTLNQVSGPTQINTILNWFGPLTQRMRAPPKQ
ncbi:MAG: protein kinase [Acidobacteriia bacterium]|nr:protein kinase [Terriglobia bacterium]